MVTACDVCLEEYGRYDEKLHAIRCNDPNATSVTLFENKILFQGIEALRHNTLVTTIYLISGQNNFFGMDSVLHMIQNRPVLTTLILINGWRWDDEYARLCDRVIHAATRNPSISAIKMIECRFSAESLLLLLAGTRTTMKLRSLNISKCIFQPSLEMPPTTCLSLESSLFNAAESNSTLIHLAYAPLNASRVDNRHIICILNGLARSVQSELETLELRETLYPPVDLIRAIQGLIVSTRATKLKTLHLESCFFTAEHFQPLAHGLRHCANASTLSLTDCAFDKESTHLLEAALHAGDHRRSISSLRVGRRCPFWDNAGYVLFNPLGPSSRLKRLEFSVYKKSEAHFAIVTQSVDRSPMLEFLHVTDVFSGDEIELFGGHCTTLTDCLPSLRTLKSLHFTLAAGWNSKMDLNNSSWSRFVEALRKNSNLIDIVGRCLNGRDYVFANAKLAKVSRYGERNKALSRLSDSDHSLSVPLWPRLATSVRRCEFGHNWMVRMMLTLEQQ